MTELLETERQKHYTQALSCLGDHQVPFTLGGAFAVYHYTGWWRHTHDVDIYVTPDCVDAAVGALSDAWFRDLGEQANGDREWIYHAGKDELIVDVIWRFANLANYVSPDWLDRASDGCFLGTHVSDNQGGHDDLHLPLGVGRIGWPKIVRALKNVGYDGTITVEVFADDDDYLVMSRDKLRKLWETTEAQD